MVSRVADRDGWRQIKETLLKNVGMNTVPVIKIEDADYGQNRTLYLKHYHDGRDLQLDYAEKTLGHIHGLWRRDVILETSVNGQPSLLTREKDGFSTRHI